MFVISVYILTDKMGEWWEYLKTDGSLNRSLRDKTFPSVDKARNYAKNNLTQDRFPTVGKTQRRFRIVHQTPPVPPSRTWGQTIVYDSAE